MKKATENDVLLILRFKRDLAAYEKALEAHKSCN